MIRRSTLAAGGAGLALLIAGATGCSSPADVTAAADEPLTAARVESLRTRQFLDDLYKPDDVRHTFRSKLDEDIDCVDFFAERGVRRLAAEGRPLRELPRAPELAPHEAARSLAADAYFDGSSDDAGRARACPEGTVPHVRLTEQLIAGVGGIDAFLAAHEKHGPGMPPSPAIANYGHVTNGWNNVKVSAGRVTLSINAPVVPKATVDHSLAQSWTTGGLGSGLQSVEVGWTVDHLQYGDSDSRPHFFIFATANGYAKGTAGEGCYNNSGAHCLTWVPIPGANLALGAALASSTFKGTQHELQITTAHHFGNSGWTVFAAVDGGRDTALGYYPDSDYGTGAMATMADTFWSGGEVYDQTNVFQQPATVPMGMGSITPLGAAGYLYNSYLRDFYYYNENNAIVTQTAGNVNYNLWTDRPGVYTFDNSTAAGSTKWIDWVYYGDSAKLFHF